MINIADDLKTLRSLFQNAGFDILFVGGCVRDNLIGVSPKDMDFCTDANPDEQIAIYKANGIKFIPTGVDHGTFTVVLDSDKYEITSMRMEYDFDGRHAKVTYTRNLRDDLSRRDLTINAISMTFDGEIFDPFNGEADLKNGVIRFVGNPSDRIQEDYLRILRYFRFLGRFGNMKEIDTNTYRAVLDNAAGLKNISKERFWMEMSKILSSKNAVEVVVDADMTVLFEHMGLVEADFMAERMARVQSNDPATMLFAMSGTSALDSNWPLSVAEKTKLQALKKFEHGVDDFYKLMIIDGMSKELVIEIMAFHGIDLRHALKDWEMPVFPVTGNDLIAKGMKPGKEMGETLKKLKLHWFHCNFSPTKESLLAM